MFLLDAGNVMNTDTFSEIAHKTSGRRIQGPTYTKILKDLPR